eukprot:4692887-Prymnesium_polylepis.1
MPKSNETEVEDSSESSRRVMGEHERSPAHAVAQRVLKSLQAALPNDASIADPHDDDVEATVAESVVLLGATTTVEAA